MATKKKTRKKSSASLFTVASRNKAYKAAKRREAKAKAAAKKAWKSAVVKARKTKKRK